MLLTVQTQHLQEEKALIFTEDAKVREQSSRTSALEGETLMENTFSYVLFFQLLKELWRPCLLHFLESMFQNSLQLSLYEHICQIMSF